MSPFRRQELEERGDLAEGERVNPMPKPVDVIQHETYKEVDIRSHPREVTRENKQQWKIRLDITFPTEIFTKVAPEYLDEEQFLTIHEAHTAGFAWGRRIIDKWLEIRSIPSPAVAKGLRGL
ncbi:MAG: hypothetical protein ABI856_20575 [Nitrospira sp.]